MSELYPVKVSIAIPFINQGEYLRRALDSVFAQNHHHSFEILIHENECVSGTRDVIEMYKQKYPGFIYTCNSSGNIVKNYLNTIRQCRGEYIATLDGSDYWTDPDKLAKQIQFLDNNPAFVLSCHRFKQLFENTKQFANDYTHAELFRGNEEGFEFGRDQYFKHWFMQTLTVVFRRSALISTAHLDTNTYCLDIQVLWNVLKNGKGYFHNFFGGVYSIPFREDRNENETLRQYAVYSLLIEELLRDEPDDADLKKALERYQQVLATSLSDNQNLLDIKKVKNAHFTIISDDGWGEEVYRGFGIVPQSPFIGTHVFNEDFVLLANNLHHYLQQPLMFISVQESKHVQNYKHSFGHPYPVARLGDKVEIHFIRYATAVDAEKKWNARLQTINWQNIFFKMNGTEEGNFSAVKSFLNTAPDSNRVCFLSLLQKKNMPENFSANEPVFVDLWNSNPKIFFPFSLSSFDLIGWLNGGSGRYTETNLFKREIFRFPGEKHEHYFIQFNEENIQLLTAKRFGKSYTIHFDQNNDSAVVEYDKSDLHFFLLDIKEVLYERMLSLSLDLRVRENRHVFILARSHEENHVMRLDFVSRDRYDTETTMQLDGFQQELATDFVWLHFDFSDVDLGEEAEYLCTRIEGVWIYMDPGEKTKGTLDIMAIHIGSEASFNEIIQ